MRKYTRVPVRRLDKGINKFKLCIYYFSASHPGYSRLIISSDSTNLTVIEVCKDCDGTPSTDLQVFMCVITNKHGSAYASAYLNVIGKE